MMRSDPNIDGGKAFDWGRTSEEYAKFRDIYPEIFYEKIVGRGLCVSGQTVLDLGTGTGVLPRNMLRYRAAWTGIDSAPEQIRMAKQLAEAEHMEIRFLSVPAEEADFPAGSFDVVTACQCFWYFDHQILAPRLSKLLKDQGRLVLLYMGWLPEENPIAGESEKLILKYNPGWTGAGDRRQDNRVPDPVWQYFDLEDAEVYDLKVPFTRESWHGRIKASRGVGASLGPSELRAWEQEHRAMLRARAPEAFAIAHYAALTVLKKKGRGMFPP